MFGIRETAQLLTDSAMATLPGEVDRLAVELGRAVAVPVPPVDPDDPDVDPDPVDDGDEAVVVDLDAQPRLYSATQLPVVAVGAADWPFLMVVPRSMTARRTLDEHVDGTRIERCTWIVRWWLYARGDGYHLTAAVRDRLTLAVMEMLLRRPAWSGTLGGRQFAVQVEVERMTVAPSDVDDALASILAGCWIECPVHVDSHLTPAAAPVATTSVTSTVRRVPDDEVHPAFQ